ncbi:MAG: enoyl-CoA hydratase-related protein [Aeromicrobium sp.]
MTEPTVLYEVSDGVALITLHRPEARNAINSVLARELLDVMATAESSDDVRVMVFTGSGPSFSGGVDLKEFRATGRAPVGASDAILAAGELIKPAIGAINGPAMTGALELVLGLDFLIASDRAVFADTHAAVGILPGGGMTARLPRAIGFRQAFELSATGVAWSAEQAHQMGLVNRVVTHDELIAEALSTARAMAQRDPGVLTALKSLYRGSAGGSLAEAIRLEVSARDLRRAAGTAFVPHARPSS